MKNIYVKYMGCSHLVMSLCDRYQTNSRSSLTVLYVKESSKENSKQTNKSIKSSLLAEIVLWSHVRIVAPGFDRSKSKPLEYSIDTLLFNFKLFSKNLVIETFQRYSGVQSRKSYPIASKFRSCNLKDYIRFLKDIESMTSFKNLPSKGKIDDRISPLTIPIITLPFRLIGFTPAVIREMLNSLDQLISINDHISVLMKPIHTRISIASIRLEKPEGKRAVYLTGNFILNKVLVREIRSILNTLSSSNRPSVQYTNQIGMYLYIVRQAMVLLNRSASEEEAK
jgi:hypothetical protein